MDFRIAKIPQILKLLARSFLQALTSYFWRVEKPCFYAFFLWKGIIEVNEDEEEETESPPEDSLDDEPDVKEKILEEDIIGSKSGTLGVKVQNMKMDFITGGTWRRVAQWTLMMKRGTELLLSDFFKSYWFV